ncbi:hypothetical protein [Carboxydothermus pertinax]|uniref:Spore coat protein n=1 Tax=Carboxydothermus pertinax TaxID=870242 RepID=A0A1L8CV14_9THEO|nr:hypothetical protein [Carboxydothermus pertinax]GAV22753.1 hypothetical protein cpu_12630 [Carboxydothermus pertinax]
MQLSQKELIYLQELAKLEGLQASRASFYAQNASDPSLKSLFSQIASNCSQHASSINSLMSQAGITMH